MTQRDAVAEPAQHVVGSADARPRTAKNPSYYYGWRIVWTLAITETISWGILYYAYAVFQVPMGVELGISPAQTSAAFSLAVLLTGVAGVPIGRWLDRHGARGLMTVGAVASAALVLTWAHVQSVLQLFLVMAGIGITRAAVLYDPAFAVVVRWFRARRSTALLAITVVAGFASTVALPSANALTEAVGWRQALVVLALVLLVATALPHWVVLRRDPADLGLRPDGHATQALSGDGADDKAASTPSGGIEPCHRASVGPPHAARLVHIVRWAARTARFRWYAVAFAAQSAAVIIAAVHLIPLLREHGHSPAFAAAVTGALGALSVTGRLVVTGLGRRLPVAHVVAGAFAVQACGVLALLAGPESLWAAVVFVLLFGIGFGVSTIARPALLADSFGATGYATMAGLMTFVVTLATTTAPIAAGVVRTATGSYTPVLVTLAVLCATAAAALHRSTRTTAG